MRNVVKHISKWIQRLTEGKEEQEGEADIKT